MVDGSSKRYTVTRVMRHHNEDISFQSCEIVSVDVGVIEDITTITSSRRYHWPLQYHAHALLMRQMPISFSLQGELQLASVVSTGRPKHCKKDCSEN
jgi:hypothetical protein